MHYFINGVRPELKSHVILAQPKSLAEAEHLAQLRDALHSNQKFAQQLQTVINGLEKLNNTQKTKSHAQPQILLNANKFPRNMFRQ